MELEFLWGEVACTEMDPRALACMEPNTFQDMVEVCFPFSHYPLVRQQNQFRSYSLAIVFCQTDLKPAKVKIPMTYER